MPGTFDRTRGRALTREVSPRYAEAVSSYFNTRMPDYEAARGAQQAYFAALRAHGSEVITLPPLEESVADFLADDFEISRMPAGATLDGGDVVFYDDRFLVGLSTRTNREGADFLTEHAKEVGMEVQLFSVPASTLHLTIVCSSPRPGTVVAAEGHLTEADLSFAEEVIWIPEEEGYAANTIAYGDRLIMAEGYQRTRKLMLDAGFSISTVEMSEFREVDASLTIRIHWIDLN